MAETGEMAETGSIAALRLVLPSTITYACASLKRPGGATAGNRSSLIDSETPTKRHGAQLDRGHQAHLCRFYGRHFVIVGLAVGWRNKRCYRDRSPAWL
jgi:hypothetical protein